MRLHTSSCHSLYPSGHSVLYLWLAVVVGGGGSRTAASPEGFAVGDVLGRTDRRDRLSAVRLVNIREKEVLANRILGNCTLLIEAVETHGGKWTIENPRQSLLFRTPFLCQLLSRPDVIRVNFSPMYVLLIASRLNTKC